MVAGSALLFAACIPSIYPFYTGKDLVFDNRLLGEWYEKGKTNDAQIWNFDKAEANTYKLKVTEGPGKTGEFSAHLFKLQEAYFLDLIPTDCDCQVSLVNASMVPGHLLARVIEFEPDLKLAFFDFDWLQKYLEENSDAVAHYEQKDRLVLTASSAELQRFVLKHLNEIFGQPGEMTRKTVHFK